MTPNFNRPGRAVLRAAALALALSSLATLPVRACTIVVITDGRRVLFCNNEDWSNPKTRIWFVPGASGRHGCAYVGFDDDWAQGGLNTQGLAFDWVAGFKEKWELDPSRVTARGNSARRMLETCSTVEEAVAFYQRHHEPSFSYGRMLVADRTGTSAIIGAKDGRLHVETMRRSRGLLLGRPGERAGEILARDPEPSLASAARVLRAARQEGKYATKYSNVFDLKSGEIFLFRFPDRDDHVRLDLAEELKKGGHYHDIPVIGEQLTQGLRPLTDEMRNN